MMKYALLSLAVAMLATPGPCCCSPEPGADPAPAPAGYSGTGEADFFVATDGNDHWSGRWPRPNADGTDGPFATLGRARDAVRSLLAGKPDLDINILIRGGTYPLTETVVFGPDDSAPDGRKVVYAAFPGEKPVFSAGVRVGPWEKVSRADEPVGIPAASSGRLWVAAVPAQARSFKSLYDGDRELRRARGKGFQPQQKFDDTSATLDKLHFPAGALRNWENLQDVEVLIRPQWPWLFDILPVAAVDEKARVATMARMGSSRLVTMSFLMPDESVWVENVPEALDVPGEWILNTTTGKVYLRPEGDAPGERILAPALTELIRLEGDEASSRPVRNLVLQGLTFRHGDRATLTRDDMPLEQGWEIFDKASALVRLRTTERCTVRDCSFTTSAAGGIRLDLRSIGNVVWGNTFADLGGSGILLSGYGPGTTDVNRQNEVVNNEVRHIGRHSMQAPGIMVTQSGSNRIAHNLVHHVPYTAIMIAGLDWFYFRNQPPHRDYSTTKRPYVRWDEIGKLPDPKPETVLRYFHTRDNVVECNEIHHALEVMGDGNGIYIWLSPRGNIVRRNYLHDIVGHGSTGAIRCDDFQPDVEIYENVVHRCSGVGIIIKHRNRVTNNIVADILPDGTTDPLIFGYLQLAPYVQPDTAVLAQTAMCQGSELQRNIFYNPGRHLDPVSDIYDNLKDCASDYNVYFSAADPERSRTYLAKLQSKGVDKHSIAADPLFVDIERGDFRLRPDSPALALGFKQLDVSRAGLLRD